MQVKRRCNVRSWDRAIDNGPLVYGEAMMFVENVEEDYRVQQLVTVSGFAKLMQGFDGVVGLGL